MDDEIIYSWGFNDVECFDSTPSAAIIILDKDLESFSSLRSQHHAQATAFVRAISSPARTFLLCLISDFFHVAALQVLSPYLLQKMEITESLLETNLEERQ